MPRTVLFASGTFAFSGTVMLFSPVPLVTEPPIFSPASAVVDARRLRVRAPVQVLDGAVAVVPSAEMVHFSVPPAMPVRVVSVGAVTVIGPVWVPSKATVEVPIVPGRMVGFETAQPPRTTLAVSVVVMSAEPDLTIVMVPPGRVDPQEMLESGRTAESTLSVIWWSACQ